MVQPWGPGCPPLALSPPEPWPPGPHAPRPRWAQSPLGLGLLLFQNCGCISLVGSGPGHTWATRNQKASRPASGLHPGVGGRGSKLPTRSRKSEVVVTYITNTKTVIDTRSHTQGHTLTCSQAHTHLHSQAQGRHWALGSAQRAPVLHVAGLWAGPWAGRGPTRRCPISPDTEFLVQEQTKGSCPEGSPQLEAALTLGLRVWKAGSAC